MLQQVAAKQEQIMQTMGPDNALVSIENYYATMVQMLEIAGFKDPQRFFKDPAQQPPTPPEPPKPDINERLIEVQMAEIQANMKKKQAELELEREKMIREDDRRRDESEANLALKAAEIAARYGAQVNTAEIKANSERDRELVRQIAQQQQAPNVPTA